MSILHCCTQEDSDPVIQVQQLQPILVVEGSIHNPKSCYIRAEGIQVVKDICVTLLHYL